MKRTQKTYLEKLAKILRVILTPIFLLVRIYYWVWDYDWNEKFTHRKS